MGVVAVVLGMVALGSYPEPAWKKYLVSALGLVGLLVLYVFGYLPSRTFMYITGALGAAFCILLTILSAFVGHPTSRRLQEFLVSVGLIAPLAASLLDLFFSGSNLYITGLMTSIFANTTNVFFNKSGRSIGVPFGFRNHESFSEPCSPASSPQTTYARLRLAHHS